MSPATAVGPFRLLTGFPFHPNQRTPKRLCGDIVPAVLCEVKPRFIAVQENQAAYGDEEERRGKSWVGWARFVVPTGRAVYLYEFNQAYINEPVGRKQPSAHPTKAHRLYLILGCVVSSSPLSLIQVLFFKLNQHLIRFNCLPTFNTDLCNHAVNG